MPLRTDRLGELILVTVDHNEVSGSFRMLGLHLTWLRFHLSDPSIWLTARSHLHVGADCVQQLERDEI